MRDDRDRSRMPFPFAGLPDELNAAGISVAATVSADWLQTPGAAAVTK